MINLGLMHVAIAFLHLHERGFIFMFILLLVLPASKISKFFVLFPSSCTLFLLVFSSYFLSHILLVMVSETKQGEEQQCGCNEPSPSLQAAWQQTAYFSRSHFISGYNHFIFSHTQQSGGFGPTATVHIHCASLGALWTELLGNVNKLKFYSLSFILLYHL